MPHEIRIGYLVNYKLPQTETEKIVGKIYLWNPAINGEDVLVITKSHSITIVPIH